MKFFTTLLFIFFIYGITHSEWENVSNGIAKSTAYFSKIKEFDNCLYAVANSSQSLSKGLYFSDTTGNNWNYIGLNGQSIVEFYKFDGNLFVTTFKNGLFFSSDNGQTWEDRNNGLLNSANMNINLNKMLHYGDTLLVSKDSDNYYKSFLYYSIDNGLNWEQFDTQFEIFHISNIYKTKNGIIVLGNQDDVTLSYISFDNCLTWEKISLSYDESADFAEFNGKLYYSLKYGNICVSDNGGKDWENYEISLSNYGNIVTLFTENDSLYMLTSRGNILYYNDDGNTFSLKYSNPLPSGEFIKYYQIKQNKIFALSNSDKNNLYVLDSLNADWREIPINIAINSSVFSIKRFGNKLYINTTSGNYYSEDLGQNWKNFENDYGDYSYITTLKYGRIVMSNSSIIKISDDNGNTWNEVNINLPDYNSSIVFMYFGDDYFLVTTSQNGSYYSKDQGVHWQKLFNTENYTGDSYYYSFVYQNAIFLNSYFKGLNYTNDFGINWLNMRSDINTRVINYAFNEKSFYLYQHYNHYLFDEYYLVKTDNFGKDWTFLNLNFNQYNQSTRWITCLKALEDKLFIGPSDGGFYYTSDDGENWIDKSQNLRDTIINDCINYKGYLYAATTEGVFREQSDDFGLSIPINSKSKILLFPNPATNYITINSHSLRGQGGASITIFDVFGNKLLTVGNKELCSLQKIDVSALPIGIYFVKIGNEKMMKFMVVR